MKIGFRMRHLMIRDFWLGLGVSYLHKAFNTLFTVYRFLSPKFALYLVSKVLF
jgi:hypothetical protein